MTPLEEKCFLDVRRNYLASLEMLIGIRQGLANIDDLSDLTEKHRRLKTQRDLLKVEISKYIDLQNWLDVFVVSED